MGTSSRTAAGLMQNAQNDGALEVTRWCIGLLYKHSLLDLAKRILHASLRMASSSNPPPKYKERLETRPSIKIRFGTETNISWDLPLDYSIGEDVYTLQRCIGSGAYSSVRRNGRVSHFGERNCFELLFHFEAWLTLGFSSFFVML